MWELNERDTILNIAETAISCPPFKEVALVLAVQDELWAPYLKFLSIISEVWDVGLAVETGTFNGSSALHLSFGCRHVVTIDRDPQENAKKIAWSMPNITLMTGDSCDFHDDVAEVCKVWGPIELLFLDSTHDGDTPRREFETYRDLFADECIVIVDDLLGPAHLREKMQAFWKWLPGDKIELHELHPQRIAPGIAHHDTPGFGVAIVRKDAL